MVELDLILPLRWIRHFDTLPILRIIDIPQDPVLDGMAGWLELSSFDCLSSQFRWQCTSRLGSWSSDNVCDAKILSILRLLPWRCEQPTMGCCQSLSEKDPARTRWLGDHLEYSGRIQRPRPPIGHHQQSRSGLCAESSPGLTAQLPESPSNVQDSG